MNVVRMWPCLFVLLLLTPTALASQGLTASRIDVSGTAEIKGPASALFAIADQQGFSWELTASEATLTRRWVDIQSVDHPTKPGEHAFTNVMTFDGVLEWNEETVPYGPISVTSAAVAPQGALLALGQAATVSTVAEGLLVIESVKDPVLDQAKATAETPGADRGFLLATLAGDHLRAELTLAEVVLDGDLTLQLFGPSYTLTAGEEALEMRTGEYELERAGPAATGRREVHEMVLEGAKLTFRSPALSEVYSRSPQVAFAGTISMSGADGVLDLGLDRLVPVDGALEWTGSAALSLSPDSGRLAIDAPAAAIATTGAIVDSGPRIAILGAALGLVAIAALAALGVRRLRSRRDDLATAILAMEERRWSDALPPLSRLAKKDPANANILVDRALVLEELGRVREAAHAFEKALRAAPRHAEAHFYYARTLAKMRESEAARVHLETALEHDPRLVELARGEKILRGL